MCFKHILFRKVLTLVLLCTIVNAACDFSIFNFNGSAPSGNVDLDNTYLESVLESVFHKDINISRNHTASHHSTSAFLFKLCSVVALHDHGIVLTVADPADYKAGYAAYKQNLHPQSFIEINSPPPQA